MEKVSVIIPARNEIYLEKTIRNILENAEGDIEILVALDGYIPDPQIVIGDDRVIFHHFHESIGQRKAINELAKLAKGKFVMKLDAHCAVDKGFDVKLAADCEYDWTVIPRMYNLDIDTWKPKRHKLTDYMYIGLRDNEELRAEYYTGDEYKQWHNKSELLGETMCCMGPCFFMHKDRFWELGGCDEEHGGWGSQGIEVSCKAWLSGGKLIVNKKTWFSHWFRGNQGFPYPLSGSAVSHARKYSKDLWLNDKWPSAKKKFQWLVDKFSPKSWGLSQVDEFNNFFYRHVHIAKKDPTWRGIKIIKFPNDLILYQQEIFKNKPDFIIETGTKFGGSSVFFGDMLELTGKGKVISIDIKPVGTPAHPRVQYLTGPSTDAEILKMVKELVKGGSVMVVLDSDRSRRHVKRELYFYGPMVTKGQFLVVEDCYTRTADKAGPAEAVDWYLGRTRAFKREPITDQYMIAITRDGWLRRV